MLTLLVQVILLLGQNYHYDLGPDVSMVVALSLDTAGSSPRYIPAILPDNVQVNIQQANINLFVFLRPLSPQHIGGGLVSMKAAKLASVDVLVIADGDTLSVYKFVPYQGLQLVDSVRGGQIVDFAVFNKHLIGEQLNIYVVEADMAVKMYTLYTKDSVSPLSLSYGNFQ